VAIEKGDIIGVQKGHVGLAGDALKSYSSFSYMFWIKPEGTSDSWANILQHGATRSERAPGLWFYPKSTRCGGLAG
jgi:hypothetical protein